MQIQDFHLDLKEVLSASKAF